MYSCGVYNDMLDLDPFTPLDEVSVSCMLCFEVKDGCTRDVYAKESGLAKYQFTCVIIDVYSYTLLEYQIPTLLS